MIGTAGAAFALLAAIAIGARAIYPRLLERRAARRRPLDADGIVCGAATIYQARTAAPAVLLLHGGGDTPQVMEDLADYLYRRGYCIRVPLLSSHGRSLSALTTASAAQWLEDARREYDFLRATNDWVAVVGLSMGGALALQLARGRDDIPALVLLAPYVAMPPAIERFAAASAWWGWMLPYFASGGGQSIRDPAAAARALGHGMFTPAALRALYDVSRDAALALPSVVAPTLVIQSREDNRISAEAAERAFERLGSPDKRMIWIDGAGHVISVDFGRERVFESTAEWLEEHRASQGSGFGRSVQEQNPGTPRLDRER